MTPLPLPIPTDPLSIGVSMIGSFIKGLFFGGPNTSERAKLQRDMCSNPKTFKPDVCGPYVWGSVNCGVGAVAAYDETGRAVRCKCPLSSLWAPTGCGAMQTIKDNWLIFAGLAATITVMTFKR